MSERPDPYAVLGVSAGATLAEIQAAYRRRVQVVHPDRIDRTKAPQAWEAANVMLAELNAAYEFLVHSASMNGPNRRQTNQGPESNLSPSPSTSPHGRDRPTAVSVRAARLWFAVAVGAVIALVVFLDQRTDSDSAAAVRNDASSKPSTTSDQSQRPFECATVEMDPDLPPGTDPKWKGLWKFTPSPEAIPSNGAVWMASTARRVAPLTIRVAGGGHFLVKLEDANSNASFIFIRSGGTAETLVPLGTYTLKYATGSGNEWCGRAAPLPFGLNTSFFRADSMLVFSDEGSHYVGHTIELILQVGGNLGTSSLLPSNW